MLYTSDSDKVMRYTDEGPVSELCKWSVDLGLLPSFQHHAAVMPPGGNGHGFYTEFELGLELDSAGESGIAQPRFRLFLFPPVVLPSCGGALGSLGLPCAVREAVLSSLPLGWALCSRERERVEPRGEASYPFVASVPSAGNITRDPCVERNRGAALTSRPVLDQRPAGIGRLGRCFAETKDKI